MYNIIYNPIKNVVVELIWFTSKCIVKLFCSLKRLITELIYLLNKVICKDKSYDKSYDKLFV